MAVGSSPFPTEYFLSGENITGFPQGGNGNIVVVVVVVVDVEASRGEAPNNHEDLYQCPSVAPGTETANYCPYPLNLISRLEFYSFSVDISTKFCLDVRYHDP